jgi:hypothetical protein
MLFNRRVYELIVTLYEVLYSVDEPATPELKWEVQRLPVLYLSSIVVVSMENITVYILLYIEAEGMLN